MEYAKWGYALSLAPLRREVARYLLETGCWFVHKKRAWACILCRACLGAQHQHHQNFCPGRLDDEVDDCGVSSVESVLHAWFS